MKELADILAAYGVARGTGIEMALATVVRVEGSAYRREGARMLITGDGRIIGGVSGGCLERDVVQRAGAVMAHWLARAGAIRHRPRSGKWNGLYPGLRWGGGCADRIGE